MQEEVSTLSATRNQLLAAMIDRWLAFYAWLHAEKGFEADPEPGEPQYCPVHGGESGRAFRFYPDMPVTGGGICNSCAGLRAHNGIDLVAGWLAATEEMDKKEALVQTLALIQEWLDEQGLDMPPEPTAHAVARWVGAYESGIAINYLQHRGLNAYTSKTLPMSVRATTSLEWNQRIPAMLALIRLSDGSPITCQVTYLEATKGGTYQKAAHHHPARRTLTTAGMRSLVGSYVELGDDAGDVLLLGEGVETVLAGRRLYQACHPGEKFWARATLGKGNFAKQSVPAGVRRILLLADVDAIPDMRDVAVQLTEVHGIPCAVVEPPAETGTKADWLDVLHEQGAAQAHETFREAETSAQAADASSPTAAARNETVTPTEETPVIDLAHTQDREIFQCFEKMVRAAPPSDWYCTPDGELVRVRKAALENLPRDALGAWVAQRVTWTQGGARTVRAARTPVKTVQLWSKTPEAERLFKEALPEIRGILSRPTLRGKYPGSPWPAVLQTAPGYDPQSKLYLSVDAEEAALVAEVSQYIARKEAEYASTGKKTFPSLTEYLRFLAMGLWQHVVSEIFRDFHFATDADAMAARAMLIAPLVAPLVPATPLFCAKAPQKGSGKTTLAQAIGNVWGGMFDLGGKIENEGELEKGLASAFLEGHPLVLLDNVSHRVDSPFLARLLTSPRTTRVRRLGSNTTLTPPQGFLLFMTANAAELQEELARRTLSIELEAADPIPLAHAQQYRHVDLGGWTENNARSLRGCLYAIAATWVRAGCPAFPMATRLPQTASFPSFELWSDVTLSLLAWCNAGWPTPHILTAFLGNRMPMLREGDIETQEIEDFLRFWRDCRIQSPEGWATVGELTEAVLGSQDILSYVQAGQTMAARIKRMTVILRRLRNRRMPLGDTVYTVEQEDEATRPNKNQQRARWRLVPAPARRKTTTVWDVDPAKIGERPFQGQGAADPETARRACEERGMALPFYIDDAGDPAPGTPKVSVPETGAAADDSGSSEPSDTSAQGDQSGIGPCPTKVDDSQK